MPSRPLSIEVGKKFSTRNNSVAQSRRITPISQLKLFTPSRPTRESKLRLDTRGQYSSITPIKIVHNQSPQSTPFAPNRDSIVTSQASPFASPTNYDINRHIQSQRFHQQISVQEIAQRNIGNLKDFKVSQLEQSKLIIETVHTKLKTKMLAMQGGDLINLQELENHLPHRLKQIFTGMPLHSSLLKDLKQLNQAFLPILDYTISFKPELGLA